MATEQAEVTEMPAATPSGIIEPSPYFQRAISLKYDLYDSSFIDFFIPTVSNTEALVRVLNGTEEKSQYRATVLQGAYGTGKSLLGTVIAGLLNPNEETRPALDRLITRLADFPEAQAVVQRILEEDRKLLPVILSGDEGDLSSALLRAVSRVLTRVNLIEEVKPPRIYKEALEHIERWRTEYPENFSRFETTVKEFYQYDAQVLIEGLTRGDVAAYNRFAELYPLLTGGAVFDAYLQARGATLEMLVDISAELAPHGYKGLIIIWDEFGHFLEERGSDPFSRDAQLLQDLAERCARSDKNQLHLMLITHKSLSTYGHSLEKEWSKIEGRFSTIEVTSDLQVAYRLIAEGIRPLDATRRELFLSQNAVGFGRLLEQTVGLGLFAGMDDIELRKLVVEGAYPLHPMATYCLPRLSDKVAQNQRTLFTFLVSEDEHGLFDLWQQPNHVANLPIVLPGQLFNYFSAGIRASNNTENLRGIWNTVRHTLSKLKTEDHFARLLVQTLAVLHVAKAYEGGAPSTDLLAFCMGTNSSTERHVVEKTLEELATRKLIRYRKLNSGWEFVEWASDVDIEHKVRELLHRQPLATSVLIALLEKLVPPPQYQARRYNDLNGMIRYFHAQYRLPVELEQSLASQTDWEKLLISLDYTDGLVIYIPTFTTVELEQAERLATKLTTLHSRICCVISRQPLSAREPLADLFALNQLENTPSLLEDGQAVREELAFFIEDALLRLKRAMSALVEPYHHTRWFINGREEQVENPSTVSRLLSRQCMTLFHSTPRIYNESLNKRNPTIQQLRACEKVIDSILSEPLMPKLGLVGFGPDVAILNTALKATGILTETEIILDGYMEIEVRIARPDDPVFEKMAAVWDVCENFFEQALTKELSFESLIHQLRCPPYGLRPGVLPIILAAVFRSHALGATVKRSGTVMVVTGNVFTEIVTHPALHTIRVEYIGELEQATLTALEKAVGSFGRQEERRGQPLQYLSQALLRWLQSLPRFARDTTKEVSNEAKAFRRIIRQANQDPARTLLLDLPPLLLPDGQPDEIAVGLQNIMGELESAFDKLTSRVIHFTGLTFGSPECNNDAEALQAIKDWYNRVTQVTGQDVIYLFSDPTAELLARIGQGTNKRSQGWLDMLTRRVVGAVPRDWNDELEDRFYKQLGSVCDRLERELEAQRVQEKPNEKLPAAPPLDVPVHKQQAKIETKNKQPVAYNPSAEIKPIPQPSNTDNEMVDLDLKLPEQKVKRYRFRRTTLSTHGKQLAENLKRTIDISGRSLSVEEKRSIALELMRYILDNQSE